MKHARAAVCCYVGMGLATSVVLIAAGRYVIHNDRNAYGLIEMALTSVVRAKSHPSCRAVTFVLKLPICFRVLQAPETYVKGRAVFGFHDWRRKLFLRGGFLSPNVYEERSEESL